MIKILANNPLVLLFVVAAIGYSIGRLNFRGNSLGVSAVLFTGLFFGALDESIQLPEIILSLGLVLFVYAIGLSSGPAFFNSYKKNGLRDFSFSIAMLLLSGLVAALLFFAMDFSAATITGIYAGSTTNTAALASVIDYITLKVPEGGSLMIEDTVVGYSFSYPMGVLGGMIAIILMEKLLKVDYKAEQKKLRRDYPLGEKLVSITIKVEHPEIQGIQLRKLYKDNDWNVSFGRLRKDGIVSLVNWSTTFELEDEVMAVGARDDLDEVIEVLGPEIKQKISYDSGEYNSIRIFVSNPDMVGKSLAELQINEKYNAIVTRIRRGDVDMLAKADTVLLLGDRIRFVAERKELKEIAKLFGDSYEASSKVNLFSFGLGLGLGLLLGLVSLQITDDLTFSLGLAGGPLIVALLLGAMGRTGPVVWTMPYASSLALQQFGLMLLLAAIGVRSGHAFVASISYEGIWIFAASTIISLVTACSILFVGYKVVKLPFSILMGMVANQPAILDFATNRTNNRLPEIGYAMIFPIALIMKIIIAQILFILLV